MKFSPLVPLRYPKEKAKGAEVGLLTRGGWEREVRVVGGADPYRGKADAGALTGGRRERGVAGRRGADPYRGESQCRCVDGRSAREGKNRRGYKYAFSGGRRWQLKADG